MSKVTQEFSQKYAPSQYSMKMTTAHQAGDKFGYVRLPLSNIETHTRSLPSKFCPDLMLLNYRAQMGTVNPLKV